jgi:hypothetical protein
MTDSNVVDFPSPKRPTREERAAQDHLDRAERVSRLREVLGQNPKMGGEDQIIVAQALHDLLERIGIPKRKVLDEAHIGSLADSTKHLSQYAIPRGLSPEEIQKKRLTKKSGPYKRIAEAAARLAGLDEGDTLLEVFGQANFWQHESVREARPDFEELASRLRFVAERISAKYELTKFFGDVETAGVLPAPTPECVQQSAENEYLVGEEIPIGFFPPSPERFDFDGRTIDSFLEWPIELNQFTWSCESEQGGDLLTYPAVVLGAWTLGSPFPVSLTRNPNQAKTSESGQGWPAVVLRFCIAPIGKDRFATPVLRVDSFAWIEHYYWVPLAPVTTTVENYEINIERVPKLLPPFGPGEKDRHASAVMQPPILFLPINGKVCDEWFSFPASQDIYRVDGWPLRDRALGDSLSHCPALAPFSTFGADTLAGIVDDALCNPTAGLDRLLEQQVKRLQDAFEASRKAARDLRDQHWEIVKDRWKKTDENS